ncbi:SWIM zinc finger [Streptacidiphilus jiangxiensis]|uniref:SWIM zinc finger n=1 Tax=Streptacidiphilus jiangxiensis TaxID=235985 RepID=A0A1H7WT13_STRJI|nr:SWIM zinc finger [Streptacidiphilus jiangxiensis]
MTQAAAHAYRYLRPSVLAEAAFFHRRLPYDAGRAESHNPRLRAARALVAAGAVRPEADGGALVQVEDHVQRVRRAADGSLGCTCLWWAKYRGGRGPCKHVLAVGLAAETSAAQDEQDVNEVNDARGMAAR